MEIYSILLVMTECKLKPLLGTTKPRFSMISRMWRNWNSHRFHTLPVGMQNSTTTLEDSLTVSETYVPDDSACPLLDI